jgi:SAM-dependent methyltransferase
LCGGDAGRVLVAAQDDWNPQGPAAGLTFQVRECRSCGGAFTSPRFREAFKQEAFLGDYPFYQRARNLREPLGEAELAAFLPRVRRLLGFHPGPGRILDLGMGDGGFPALMQRHGWGVCGVDFAPETVAFAREVLGLEGCVVGDVERDPLPPGPYDAVTLWGLLQLTYSPRKLLAKARAALAPGGLLGVGVSNIAGAGARLFGRHWRGLGLPRHLVHFSPATLRRLVEQEGFQVLALDFQTPEWIVAGSVRSALALPRVPDGLARRAAGLALRSLGRSRLGDTMILVARAQV